MVLLGAVALIVAQPLLRSDDEAEPQGDDEPATLEAEKQAKYREIRDLEMDFRSGKLSEADYKRIDAQLRREAIEILKREDQVGSEPGR